MKVILVPIAYRPECSVVLGEAFRLAEAHEAFVIGCHIRPHRDSKVRVTLPSFSGGSEADWLESMEGKDAKRLSANAESFFTRLADRHGLSVISRPRKAPGPAAIWSERVGSPSRVMPIIGPVSDLLMVSRPARKGGKIARVFLLEALLHSSRPVLIIPQKAQKSLGSRVLIAWNQSAEAMRAITAALPMMRNADEVTVFSAGPEVGLGPKARQVAEYLKAWGIDARVKRARNDNAEKEIMHAYRDARADLLVMGAYSRSRLRELVFGGTTEYMLNKADIPVLIHHG